MNAPMDAAPPAPDTASMPRRQIRQRPTYLAARGEPYVWLLGGALTIGIVMILGFLLFVAWNGIVTFWPKPLVVVTKTDGKRVAGEPFRDEAFRPGADTVAKLAPDLQRQIRDNGGLAHRVLYRTGNYDIYNEDFSWVADYEVARTETPADLYLMERLEWGVFVGRIKSVQTDRAKMEAGAIDAARLAAAHAEARARFRAIRSIEHDEIGAVNYYMNRERLRIRRAELEYGAGDPRAQRAADASNRRIAELQKEYQALADRAARIKADDAKVTITLVEVSGKEKTQKLSEIVRMYPANALSLGEKIGVYFSRWGEFLSDQPREANTEGGVLPAIFGTAAMTILLSLIVAPFGVITALYLREYAKQGRIVSAVRISVNNLAGVPSIVYGVFGLGFFAYIVGASVDQLFFTERLPNPTFGTGGLLWASLTLALLTVPVVIVATEEALAAVPRSMREGSLACGASKWQTIRRIVLPRAMPGIMTGLILAMARGAGEVAPLMLVGVVKLAPELPVDGFFPYIHLERSFMHLGFHIFDVGFQSRNSEAGKPMVFVTTLLLIALIAAMNLWAIIARNRMKRRMAGSTF
jgi:phosphate transport system permease protein